MPIKMPKKCSRSLSQLVAGMNAALIPITEINIHIREICKIVENALPAYRSLFLQYANQFGYVSSPQAMYLAPIDTVILDLSFSDARGYYLLFHEVAHGIDDKEGGALNLLSWELNRSGQYLTDVLKEDVRDGIRRMVTPGFSDVEQVVTAIMTEDPSILSGQSRVEYNKILQSMNNCIMLGRPQNCRSPNQPAPDQASKIEAQVISDIYGALTGGLIEGAYHHDEFYWDVVGIVHDMPSMEFFASYFAQQIMGDPNAISYTCQWLGNGCIYAGQLVNEMAR